MATEVSIHGVMKTNEDGTFVYELGVIYFEPCMRDTSKYKKMMTWWLVDIDDVLSKLQNPTVEKISGKGILYSFNLK